MVSVFQFKRGNPLRRNNILLYASNFNRVFQALMRKDIIPPDPELFLKDFIQNKKIKEGEETSHWVLRRGTELMNESAYIDFLSMFGMCLFHEKEWKKYATSKLLSEYMNESLEAFGVVVYYNNYDYWKSQFARMKEKGNIPDEDASTTSSSTDDSNSVSTKFTGGLSSSAGRYYGWSPEGIHMYNDVRRVLIAQRSMTVAKEFEQKVLKANCLQQKKNRQDKKCIVFAQNSLKSLFAQNMTAV